MANVFFPAAAFNLRENNTTKPLQQIKQAAHFCPNPFEIADCDCFSSRAFVFSSNRCNETFLPYLPSTLHEDNVLESARLLFAPDVSALKVSGDSDSGEVSVGIIKLLLFVYSCFYPTDSGSQTFHLAALSHQFFPLA